MPRQTWPPDGFDSIDSWRIGEAPSFGFVIGLAVTLAFAVAGASYVGHANWWPGAMMGAAALSLLLLALFASPWFVVGYPISMGLAIWAWQAQTTA